MPFSSDRAASSGPVPVDALDAARYRWLRNHPDGFQLAAVGLTRRQAEEEGRLWREAHPWGGSPKRYPLALDAAIDAAMAAEVSEECRR